MLRLYDVTTKRKAQAYKHCQRPWLAYYAGHPHTRRPVIVEDQLSAMRLWQLNINAIALLGTALTQPKYEEIRAHWKIGAFDLALDRDAFHQAVKFANRYAGVRPLPIPKDIKDMDDAEIYKWLRG